MSFLDPSMEDLPVNVMVDILSRLPVKTIIHCKCVCKSWLDLLSDSSFANLHLSRSPPGLMIHHRSEKEMTGYIKPGILKWVEVEDELDHHHLHHDPLMSLDLKLAPIFHNSEIRLVGSVNGLICLWQYGPTSDNTYICNPITKEYMILPRPQYYREVHQTVGYGFGFGSLTREYKVIQIFREYRHPSSNSTSEAEVYTIGTGQWRSIGHVPYWPIGTLGPFLNGHAHWTVFYHGMCAFDFDTETFKLFPSPPPEASISRIDYQSLGVVKGCLCRCDADDSEFRIWVMKEYGIKKSWCKEVIIKQGISADLDSLMCPLDLVEGLKDGTILMVSYEDKLLAYSPRRKTIVDTEIFERYFNGLSYRPSFHRLHYYENERVHVF